jgi:cytochrome c oxidase assembly protein subunit 15
MMSPPLKPSPAKLSFSAYVRHGVLVLTLVCTVMLIGSGGLVTSKGVGMAVPDWPTTYGYNMFLFPVSKWVGGIFYEHTHRLLGSLVGFLMLVSTMALLAGERRYWVKVLGVIGLGAVIVQGVLGGLRVTLFKDEIGIFHGMLAQAFLCLLAVLCLVTAPMFLRGRFAATSRGDYRMALLGLAVLIFVQLGVAASMRHAHAGLSIPDFPLAYGQLWPSTSPEAVAAINTERLANNTPPTTSALIWLQMKHRLLAYAILVWAGVLFWRVWRERRDDGLIRLVGLLLCFVVGQAALGAWTIWSNKAADVATAHVLGGAFCLVLTVLCTFRQFVGDRQRAGAFYTSQGRVLPEAAVLASTPSVR